MNDLAQYNVVRGRLAPGDVIVFWGDPLNPLTLGIEAFSGGPSHSGLVRQGVDSEGNDAVLEQSTRPILLGKGSLNGVQHEYLGDVLAGYGAHAHAAALLLSEDARKRFDLFRFYEFIGEADGAVRYDTADLFEFLVRSVPVVGARLWQGENAKAMVCSGFVTACLIRSGVLGAGINWSEWSPQNLVQAGIYSEAVPLLGNPKLVRFNSLK